MKILAIWIGITHSIDLIIVAFQVEQLIIDIYA
jgi:phosphopantetheinyl transferase